MVKFKIYDKRQKKFVGPGFAGKAWTERYNLGIWDNGVRDTKLGQMFKIMNNNDKHLELYVKIDGRYKPVSKEAIDTVENEYKKAEPERNERRKKFKEKLNQNKIKNCQGVMKDSKKSNLSPREQKRLTRRNKYCKALIKKNNTKKR